MKSRILISAIRLLHSARSIVGFIFLAMALWNCRAVPQDIGKTVATVGGEKISSRELKIRYELLPHLSPHQQNPDSSKKFLLYSMIAEKLLAKEAAALGYAATDYYRESAQIIADLYTRDALYNKAIAGKVRISSSDIQEALDRFSKTLHVRIISAPDSSSVFGYYHAIVGGANFDSVASFSDPLEYAGNKPPMKITYGQMSDERVENVLYGLKVGKFSPPVRTENGWFIFKLVSFDYRVPPNASDADYNKSILEVIRMRKSRQIGLKYLDALFRDKHAIVDSAIFRSLAEKISAILSEKERTNDFGEEGNLYLSEGNIMQIAAAFGSDSLDQEIVHSKPDPISLKEYLYSLLVYPYLAKDASLISTARKLMGNLDNYIEYRFLSKEGTDEGLDRLPEVMEDSKIWSEDYLAKMLKNTFRDSVAVSESEVKDYFIQTKEHEKLSVLEIHNSNSDTLMSIMERLHGGADFHELAARYSMKSSDFDSQGEPEYRTADSLGAIGKIAANMKIGEVYGPIKTDDGYSILKLVGRKLENKEREQVDIREILTHSLDTVETIFRALNAGEDFSRLASRYTEREWTKSDSGRFGYFSIYSFGDIGRIASGMKPGEIYGPIATDSGYSIIKLIDKRYDTTAAEKDFDSDSTELRKELLGKKFDEKFFKYIAGLAGKYGYTINQDVLKEIKVIDIPMFTYRYIGFGGRITAFPYLGPWYDWVKYFEQKSVPVP